MLTDVQIQYIRERIANNENLKTACINNQNIRNIVYEHWNKRLGRKSVVFLLIRFFNNNYHNICSNELTNKEETSKNLAEVFCTKHFEERIVGEEKKYYIKIESFEEIALKIYKYVYELETGVVDEPTQIENMSDTNDITIDDNTTYEKFREFIGEDINKTKLKYDFTNYKNKLGIIQVNNKIQILEVDIKTEGQKVNFPIMYVYVCPACERRHEYECYKTNSCKNKITCMNPDAVLPTVERDENGNVIMRPVVCRTQLNPDYDLSYYRDVYIYQANIMNEDGKMKEIEVMSFNSYNIGRYVVAAFRVDAEFKGIKLHIVDVLKQEENKFNLPELNINENYFFTVQKEIDNYISKQIGNRIWGLLPIKIAFLVQAVKAYLKTFDKNAHIQIVGDKSTGKTTVGKYYGFVLYGNLFKSTNGMSVSIPGLRGGMRTINLHKEIKIPNIGMLGVYKGIQIDEMKENKDLLEQSKAFLSEITYSYDKIDSDRTIQERTAQFCVCENLSTNEKGMYIGQIRKNYKTLCENRKEAETWDNTWNLYMPLTFYNNEILRGVIHGVRQGYLNSERFWIDSYSLPLHDRFPFYFYLIREKDNSEIDKLIFSTDNKAEKFGDIELCSKLRNNDIKKYIESTTQYLENDDSEDFYKINDILKEYKIDMETDIRRKKFYKDLLVISRIFNKRHKIEKMDFDLLRWFIENTECSLDVAETNNYNIKGASNVDINLGLEKFDEIKNKSSFDTILPEEFD